MTTEHQLDLDAIQARADAATEGPWHLTDDATIVAPLSTDTIADVWEPTQESRNGEFIEAARTDVPALLAEVRHLRAELARRVQCNDCGAVGSVFTGDDGRAYLNPSGEIGFAST